jgi:AcrR family transcriptional regulator
MLEGIDEKILIATLDEGGSNATNRFSTVRIAKACDISEFTIYDHFTSKNHLLAEADVYLGKQLDSFARQASAEATDFLDYFSKMMDFQLAHPTWNGFFLNYSRIFPRFGLAPDEDDAEIWTHLTETGRMTMSKFITPKSQDEVRDLFLFFFREVVCYSRYVIAKDVADTPRRRELEAKVVFGGLNSFRYVKEKGPVKPTPIPTHVKSKKN